MSSCGNDMSVDMVVADTKSSGLFELADSGRCFSRVLLAGSLVLECAYEMRESRTSAVASSRCSWWSF